MCLMKPPNACPKCGDRPSLVSSKGIPIQYQYRCYSCMNATPFFLSEREAIASWNGSLKKSMDKKFFG